MRTPIFVLAGKAKQVFKLIELLSQVQGNKTLGELCQTNTNQ